MSISEKDAVLRERKAFVAGAAWGYGATLDADVIVEARSRFPLPKVTRPRVVNDPNGAAHRWTVRDGQIRPSVHWSPNDLLTLEKITPERVKLWADLLANPTEEVEA